VLVRCSSSDSGGGGGGGSRIRQNLFVLTGRKVEKVEGGKRNNSVE